jgi:N-6 DNA Methylase/TaqI-like C-terminal specificity domain
MTLKTVEAGFATIGELSQRWPDQALSIAFRELMTTYQRLSAACPQDSSDPRASVHEAYRTVCKWIEVSLGESSDSRGKIKDRRELDRAAVRSLIVALKVSYGDDWLQSLASLLGMLMHFSKGNRDSLLINHRRPQKPFSTYPTSPSVAKFLGDAVISYLVKLPIPTICHNYSDAERYAERALTFRVLDPSMESGQLLLEVARACLRRVLSKHSSSDSAARYLSRGLLGKLCRDCLWGIDRNELGAVAVRLSFALLGLEFGIQSLAPFHLLTADALEDFNQEQLPKFDGIVNNPPWGEGLRPAERKRLREMFSTLRHQSDTYVAFSELAIRCLAPEGVFALILPSQVIAARNTSRLRELLLSRTELDEMILLPRAAFADATVRGLVLLGRARPATRFPRCRIITYPLVKSFDAIGPARSFTVRSNFLRAFGASSWWPLFSANGLEKSHGRTVVLEQIANVVSGVCVYRLGDGVPPQTAKVLKRRPFTFSKPDRSTTPVLRGRDVHEFSVSDPQQFIRFGEWLAWVGNHDSLRRSKRIFVRELCRRDGKLSAAVARDGFIPLRGVLTVVPRMINVNALVGILNSAVAADYVSKHTASFSKVDFQKIVVSELRHMPIPIAAVNPGHRSTLGLPASTERERSLHRRLMILVRRLSSPETIGDSKTEKLLAEMNAVVAEMYSLTEDDIA